MLNENTRLNDTYTLKEEIGSGGGGIVYKAYHERLQTDVVVKKVRERVKGKLEGRAEADILKQMKHTYLPRVYDFLEIDGEIYTVIDYIPGRSLDKELAEKGRFSQSQVLKWSLQLAEALAYLHSQKPPIIHSDIKPANIMLTPEDNICLIDFNISLAFDRDMRNSIGISGGYSPPEQYHDLTFYQKFAAAEKTEKASSQSANAEASKGTANRSASRDTEIASDTTAATELASDTATVAATPASDTETAAATELAFGMETAAAGDTATELASTTETAPETGTAATEAASMHTASTEPTASATATATESAIESMVGQGIDARSDIYSLGATIYHLLTGIKPSRDFEKIVPISQCDVHLSEGFVHIIEKMMEILPENRYQDGNELLYTLQHIYELDSEYRAYRRGRRNRKIGIACLYLVGAVLLGAGSITLNNERNLTYNELVTTADTAIESGEYETAQAAIQEAEELIPERVEAYSKEALLLYQQGSYEECISYTETTLQDAPYNLSDDESSLGDLYYILGNAYLETENYSSAVFYLENAISLNTSNSLYYRDYAIALAKTGNADLAESALEEAISLGLGEDSIYMVQGEIAYARGSYEEAETCLLQAISASETDSLRRRAVLLCDKVYRALGTDYIDTEIALLEQEVNQYAGTSTAMNLTERLADAYVRKAEADETEAVTYYEKALACFQTLFDNGYSTRQMMENIAVLYQQLDEFEQAEAMLLQMVEQYPDSYEGYKRLAYLEADEQQEKENADRSYEQMKEYYDKAKELYGDQDDDQEMQMLDVMIQDLIGNWL
ncbi:MAG: protein kinase [Lachnospiraceae bacterium]|nr:protein kinase [Lachnospiraceae bacterium]